jgi:hypothetical protein
LSEREREPLRRPFLVGLVVLTSGAGAVCLLESLGPATAEADVVAVVVALV